MEAAERIKLLEVSIQLRITNAQQEIETHLVLSQDTIQLLTRNLDWIHEVQKTRPEFMFDEEIELLSLLGKHDQVARMTAHQPQHVQLHVYSLLQLKRWEEIIHVCIDAPKTDDIMQMYGVALLRLGKFKEALTTWELVQHPKVDVRAFKVECFEHLEMWINAEDALSQLVNEGDHRALYRRALFYRRFPDRQAEASKDIDAYISAFSHPDLVPLAVKNFQQSLRNALSP